MQRQRMVFDRRTPVWAVIDEAALHQQIGNTEVMREQIEHLIKALRLNDGVLVARERRPGPPMLICAGSVA